MATDQVQQLTLFIKESKIISSDNVMSFNSKLQAAIDNGWIQNGAPFACGGEMCINMIKIDGRLMEVVGAAIDLAIEQLAQLRG